MAKKKFAKTQHAVFHGKEPNWEDVTIDLENYQPELATGLNYYSTISLKDRRKYFVKWAREQGKTTEEISNIPTDFLITISSLCRMLQRHFPINKETREWMLIRLDSLLKEHKKEAIVVDKEEEKLKKIYKDEAVDNLIGQIMNTFDVVIDEQLVSDRQLKVPSADCSKVNVGQMNSIVDYYERQLIEFKLVYNKADLELVEGYARVPRKRISYLMKLHVSILDELKKGQLMNKAKRPIRTKKKKVKTADQLTSKVKYMNVCEEYNIISIDPANIIGKNVLYLFNTKYRKIQVYKSVNGFGMKGTTIQDFDDKESYSKTIRKPKEFFDKFVTEPKVRSNKIVESVNSKKAKVTGRINDMTIIIKVY